MNLILFVLMVLPEAGLLYLLEAEKISGPEPLIAAYLALILIIIGPLSRLCCHLIIGREITELYTFSLAIKHGNYKTAFVLPNELEDEPEIIKLKRTLNWMAHSLFVRDKNQQQSIVENKELKLHYEQLSVKDELTGLYNRRYFNEKLSHHITRAMHSNNALCLMMIDVDNFKKVNDSYGHLEGDDLLKKLAAILKLSSRSEIDIPFRYGGDEFGIILPGIHAASGHTIGCRIKQNYTKIAPGITSLSIGVASLQHDYGDVAAAKEELIKAADLCVYAAKRSGRNSVIIEDQQLQYTAEQQKN